MPQFAYNPTTGKALYFDGSAWVDVPTAKNRAGDVMALWDGEWSKVGTEKKNVPKIETVDPTGGMSGFDKFLAGTGKAFVDLGRGVKQVFGADNQQEIDLAKERDAALLNTGAGVAGNITGNVAALLPTAFVPGANTYTGAATLGGLMSALQPTATGESRLVNAALGAGTGALGKATGDLVGRALRPVQSTLSGAEKNLAAAAQREGIPLTAGQATGSRPLQITESVMENLPLTAGPQLAGREAQQRAFTSAALKRAGISADTADAAVLVGQKEALGKTMRDIANRGAVDFNKTGLTDRLADIVDDAAKHLPDDGKDVSAIVDKILAQVDESGKMLGTNYQGWREPLRTLAKQGGKEGHYYGQIRSALDKAFDAGQQGQEAAAFREASRKYANLKTIIDAMGGAGSLPAKGQVSPAQLSSALARSVGREGKALGRGDLNELARVGQTFVPSKLADSFTSQRQLYQALLTSGGGALVGGGAGLLSGGDVAKGAMTGAALTGGALLSPRLIQILMNSKAGQAYLRSQLAGPALLGGLSQAGRIGAGGGLLSIQ